MAFEKALALFLTVTLLGQIAPGHEAKQMLLFCNELEQIQAIGDAIQKHGVEVMPVTVAYINATTGKMVCGVYETRFKVLRGFTSYTANSTRGPVTLWIMQVMIIGGAQPFMQYAFTHAPIIEGGV